MKLLFSDLSRKLQYPPLLACMITPVSLLIFAVSAVDALSLAWLFPVLYLAGAWTALFIPGKRRLWAGLAGCALLLALGAAVAFFTGCYAVLAASVLYAAALLLGLPIAGWTWKEELPGVWLLIGVCVHVVAQILVNATRAHGSAVLEPVAPWILACFLGFVPLAMLCINRKNLIVATMRKQKAAANVWWKNTAIVLLFFVVVLLVSMLPVIADAIEAAWNWLITFLVSIKLPERNSSSITPANPTEDIGGDILTFPETEQSPFDKFLLAASRYIAIGMTAGLLVFLLVWLLKKLPVLLRWLSGSLNRFAHAAAEDYEDEITDTRDLRRQARRRSGRLQHLAVNERKLPPREQIRYRYRRLLKKHPEWSRSSTARSNLPEDMADCYERARYSDRALTEEEARQFTSGIQRL